MDALKKITAFCEQYSTPLNTGLKELERETHLKTLSPQMLTGPLQGQFLNMLSAMLRPKAILEIGTFTGYATICLAMSMAKKGIIYTIEANPELTYISQKFFKKAGIQNNVRQFIGDAKDIIPTLQAHFDIVYIDAAKNEYSVYYDLAFDKVNKGGLIIADNALWGGKVMARKNDSDTQAIQDFNKKVLDDKRVENMILPIRDGLMIARKI